MRKEHLMMKEAYETEFLKNNFNRSTCKKCGHRFWSRQHREDCSEPPCGEYEFIGKPMMPKGYTTKEMRTKFLEFFQSKNHSVTYRYPVVCRWKPDTMFVGASIYDFMPWVVNGTIEPPANPLIVSQPCFRAQDLDNIGLGTARHMSVFEMVGHHAFNYPENQIYWKEETVKLCYDWLVHLGIDPSNIIFKESWWEGGGNAGPCFEVMVGGSEVATLVFMEYEGPFNGEYKPMKIKTVDTGYGLERHVWISQGTPTVYDCTYPELIEWLVKKAKLPERNESVFEQFCKLSGSLNVEETNVEKLRERIVKQISLDTGIHDSEIMNTVRLYHNIYQVIDHTKAIMFILGDGVVPSNVKEGYLARLLIRRSIRALRDLGVVVPLRDIVERQINYYKGTFPEYDRQRNDILKMVGVEEKKYEETLKRGKQIVKGLKKIDQNILVQLYESHGLLPRDVKNYTSLEMPDISDLETKMAVHKSKVKEETEPKQDVSGLPETELLFYKDETRSEFKAKVLRMKDGVVVLDSTCFYPRGGGQEPDHGEIEGCKVYDIEKQNNVVLHFVENPKFKEGQEVSCRVDMNRRKRIVAHHSATHIIAGCVRKLLGDHIWQGGSKKDVDKAHIDFTHYEPLNQNQIDQIEKCANEFVKNKVKVSKKIMKRTAAEKDYGFRIYQGGAVPGKYLRIVAYGNHDVEACGGIHVDNSSDVGEIVIMKVERPTDGTIRLIYKAGQAAREYLKVMEGVMFESAELLGVSENEVLNGIGDLKKEWKEKRKQLDEKLKNRAEEKIENLKFEVRGNTKFLIKIFENTRASELQKISERLSGNNTFIALFGTRDGGVDVFVSSGEDVELDAGIFTKEICDKLEGKGGGTKLLGRGFVKDMEKLREELKRMKW